MKKKILITSTDVMMLQFLVPHVFYLQNQEYEVEVACSNVENHVDELKDIFKTKVKMHLVELKRNPMKISNVQGLLQLMKIIKAGSYDIVWTNEPVMGIMTRLAARIVRRKKVKIIYVAHGFHFYKGAPKKNWIIYYPIEKLMASRTDVICTVNREDYKRAKGFNVKDVKYIHGIGINTERLTVGENQKDIRKELGLDIDDFFVLSVGELNENKNQKVIIQALSLLKDKTIHYVLCGKGNQMENLKNLVEEKSIKQNVHFLGYRTDVVDICSQVDVYVMPSKREGLPVASLEAMYCGLPLVTSNIRGLTDVMENGVSGYMCNPEDAKGFAKGIKKLKENPKMRKKMGEHNRETVKPYCIEATKKEVLKLIMSFG